jgi:hypothetical protein
VETSHRKIVIEKSSTVCGYGLILLLPRLLRAVELIFGTTFSFSMWIIYIKLLKYGEECEALSQKAKQIVGLENIKLRMAITLSKR